MKITNFVKWQIKRWLPLFIVVFVMMFSTLSLNGKGVLFSSDSIWIYSMLACGLPFFCFSERYEKGAADAYRAFPTNDKQIKRVKILTMLIFIVVVCTVVYLLSTIVYISEYGSKPDYSSGRYYTADYDKYGMISAGPSAFLLCYGLMIVFTTTTFLFNCTLASLGNNAGTGFLYVVSGNILLTLTIPSILFTFSPIDSLVRVVGDLENGFLGAGGIFGKAYCIDSILNSAFVELDVDNVCLTTANAILFSILFVIEIGVGVLGFFLKDPSGEYYSMPGARDERHKIIIYCAMGVMYLCAAVFEAIFIESTLFGVIVLMIFIMLTIYAYISLVIFNKRFKLTKKEMIIFGSIILGGIIFMIIDYARIHEYIKKGSNNRESMYMLLSLI